MADNEFVIVDETEWSVCALKTLPETFDPYLNFGVWSSSRTAARASEFDPTRLRLRFLSIVFRYLQRVSAPG
jgi:hypothetical protein